jgi:hypothetical protein
MTRGVVLWPDDRTSIGIRSIWNELAANELPSMTTETHRLHRPHVSLIVADRLNIHELLASLGRLPSAPIPLLIESIGLVPGGHLLLTATPHTGLLAEQDRIHRTAKPFADGARSHYEPGQWLPHLTVARGLTPEQVRRATSLVLPKLPIRGSLISGGIEDGRTGEQWPAPPSHT